MHSPHTYIDALTAESYTYPLTSKIFFSFVVFFPLQTVHRSESEAGKGQQAYKCGQH